MSHRFLPNDMEKLRRELMNVDQELSNFSLSEEGFENFIVIGNTGSGKSTFISFGMGLEMNYKMVGPSSMPEFHITHKKERNSEFPVPMVGNKPISETATPRSYLNVGDKINFIDTPGHMSSEGEIIEIRDSYANSRVFSQNKNIRFIIMISCSELFSTRGKSLKENIKKIYNLFPKEFDNVMKSAYIMISKVSERNQEQYYIEKIKDITKLQAQESNFEKEIEESILNICNTKRVVCFLYPSLFKKEEFSSILSAIKRMQPYKLKNCAKLMISSDGRILVGELAKQTQQELENIETIINNKISSRMFFQKSMHPLTVEILRNEVKKKGEIVSNLCVIETFPEKTKELYEGFLNSIEMDDNEKQKFFQCLTDLRFCQTLDQNLDIQPVFIRINEKLKQYILELKVELEKHVGKEEINRIKEEQDKETKKRESEYNEQIIKIKEEQNERLNKMERFYTGAMEEMRRQIQEPKKKRHSGIHPSRIVRNITREAINGIKLYKRIKKLF